MCPVYAPALSTAGEAYVGKAVDNAVHVAQSDDPLKQDMVDGLGYLHKHSPNCGFPHLVLDPKGG